MKKVIMLFVIVASTLSSCNCKCTKTHLSKDEKEWFSAYKKGQQIIFKSNLGKLDTLFVADKYETYDNKECNCYEVGNLQYNMMHIDFKSRICHNDSYCVSGVSISKDEINKKSFPTFNVFGLFYPDVQVKPIPTESWVVLRTSLKKYTHVYVFEDGINAKNFGNNYLKSFYWDKREGLIRYDTGEGEIFELLKK
ncbi:hypothetical protein ACHRV5_04325 [Flavobacterium sp. FlaQc-52]|jgi:hypothetical protein|uniref:hypothetical protein n=1 Tax=Flavobacterium sp. FlaQc-52 TaxID=3374185 RepID=UPI00375842A3